jgi:hypothetical protein
MSLEGLYPRDGRVRPRPGVPGPLLATTRPRGDAPRHNTRVGAAVRRPQAYHRLDPAELQILSFGLAPAPLCFITYAATRMEPTSDTCPIVTRLPSDNRSGGIIPADSVLEPPKQAENALHSAGPGWNPYEVWWTQVRAVQLARSSNMHSALPGAKREQNENSWNADLSKVTRAPLGKLLKWRWIRLPDR